MTSRADASAKRYGQGRGGRPWRRLVERVKVRDAMTCQACRLVTGEGACDHVVPLSRGGTDALTNLQWLCVRCHEDKNEREAGGKRVRIDAQGWPIGREAAR